MPIKLNLGRGNQKTTFAENFYNKTNEYFKPVPDKVRARDIIREIPGAAKQVFGNIAKNVWQDTKDVVQNPQELPNIVNKRYVKPTVQFAQKMGEAAAQPYDTKMFEGSIKQSSDQADLYLKKAIEFSKAGDKEKADRYFDAARKIGNYNRQDIQARIDEKGQSKIDTFKSGVGTANTFLTAANPAASALTMGVGGVLNAGIEHAMGNDEPNKFFRGVDNASRYAGFVNVSNPIIAGIVGKFAGNLDNPVTKQATARLLNGIGNLTEDYGLAQLYGEEYGVGQALTSFILGAILSGEADVKNWQKLKNEFKLDESGFKFSSDKEKAFFDNLKELRDQYVGEMKSRIGDSEGSQAGFVRLGSEPKVDLNQEATKYDSADEFIKAQDIDSNKTKIYNEIYGEKESTVKLGEPGQTPKGSEVGRIDERGTTGGVPKVVTNAQPPTINTSKLAAAINDNPDGFTLKLDGEPVTTGFVVSPYKGRELVVKEVDESILQKFINNNKDLLELKENYVGGWRNTDDGMFYLDVSVVKNNIDGAMEVAVKNDQIAVYDIDGGHDVKTNDFLTEKLTDIYNQAKVDQPKAELEPGMRDRTFLKRLEESPETSGELKAELETLPQQYKQKSSIQAQKVAEQLVEDDLEGAIKKFDSENITGQEKVVTGYALLDKLQQVGRTSEARRVADEITSDLTSAGRTIEAAKVLTRLDGPTFQLKVQKIFDEMNKRKWVFGDKAEMTDELVKQITKTMDLVKATDSEAEKLRLVKELLDNDIAPKIPPGFSELLDSYRYNNMLSSPRSWAKNLYGNLFQTFVAKPLTMAFEAPIDFVRSLKKGVERQHYIADVPKYYKNLFNSVPNGFLAFTDTMKDPTFLDLEDGFLSTASLERYLQAKRTPGVLTIGSRPMEALDKLLSVPLAASEKARLMDLGLDEKQAEKQAGELAERWLFRSPLDPNNKSGQGYLLSSIDQIASWIRSGSQKIEVAGVKPLNWMTPFINTPTQLVKQLIEFSPAGAATTIGSSSKRATEQLAKSIAGTMAMWVGFQLALDTETTWAFSTNEEQRTLQYDSGMKQYSVKVGDKWIPLAYLGTLGLALAVPAAYKYYDEQSPKSLTDTEFQKIQKMVSDTIGYVSSQTSVPTLLEILQILMGQSNRELGDVAGFTSTQVIPFSGMLRFISQILDPIYRQADNFMENVQRATPLKNRLDPYLTSEGEPSTRSPLEIFAPFSIGQDKPEYSQRLEELQRIQQIKEVPAWYKREAGKIQESIQEIYKNVEMTDEEREKRLEKEFDKLDKLQEKYELLIPKTQDVLQQPRMQEQASPSIEQGPAPAQLQPTLAPVNRRRLVL